MKSATDGDEERALLLAPAAEDRKGEGELEAAVASLWKPYLYSMAVTGLFSLLFFGVLRCDGDPVTAAARISNLLFGLFYYSLGVWGSYFYIRHVRD